MRVTMVNKYYPPHVGGIEFHVRDLAEGLVERGVATRVLVSNEGGPKVVETIGGVEVTRLARAFKISSAPVAPGMSSAIRAEATREDPADLLHLHFPYPWGDLSWLRARTGLPTVLSYHSDIVRQKVMLAAYRPFLERLLDRVDLIVTGSPNMVEHSPFLFRHAEKCRVVPYGIRVERFEETPEVRARADQLRAGHERPIVLFVGRLIYYKGVDVLLRAMTHLDADVVIIGRGPLESRLREQAVALGLSGRVMFLPQASDDDLVAWYHAADVLCLPSTEPSEAFGLVQIEAHASGTPVVSTQLPSGVPFANKDGETGFVVEVGSSEALAGALHVLLADPALRRRFGVRARERALFEFSVPRMVERMLGVYGEIVPAATRIAAV